MVNKKTDEKPDRDDKGLFLPGSKARGPGRPKGSRNAVTMTLKQALMDSFWQVGGPSYFVQLAKADPDAYIKLILQILPKAAPESADSDTGGDIFDDPDPDL